jgi:hypothetical protein
MKTDKNHPNNYKIIIVFMAAVIVILLCLVAFPNLTMNAKSLLRNPLAIISPNEAKKSELIDTYNKISQFEVANDYAALYEFLTPNEKSQITLSDYVQQRSDEEDIYNLLYLAIDAKVHGEIGIITRTVSYCEVEGCNDSERKLNTSKKKYEYINGNWYHEFEDTLYCSRQEPYTVPPEFERGFSLIIQRLGQSPDPIANKNTKRFDGIKNCLDIQYANSDDEMSGAEGLFMFSPDSSPERLQIFVSPRYQAKDDLLTAILLSHEVSHALIFAMGNNNLISCYKNESIAFREQARFMSTLNLEEVASITYRYNNRSSEEAVSVINLIVDMKNSYGNTPEEKSLNYVMNNPFYQEQCME